jgi:hypothetical protein
MSKHHVKRGADHFASSILAVKSAVWLTIASTLPSDWPTLPV